MKPRESNFLFFIPLVGEGLHTIPAMAAAAVESLERSVPALMRCSECPCCSSGAKLNLSHLQSCKPHTDSQTCLKFHLLHPPTLLTLLIFGLNSLSTGLQEEFKSKSWAVCQKKINQNLVFALVLYPK